MKIRMDVDRLSLHISLSRHRAVYEVGCRGRVFVGQVSDPVDFVAEFGELMEGQPLCFSDCMLELTTEADCVERNYLMANNAMYLDRVCILRVRYTGLLAHDICRLPVRQHCMSFFGLYLNAVRYLKTIQETT